MPKLGLDNGNILVYTLATMEVKMPAADVPDQKFIDHVSVLVLLGVLTKEAAVAMIEARRRDREMVNEAATRLIEGMRSILARRPR